MVRKNRRSELDDELLDLRREAKYLRELMTYEPEKMTGRDYDYLASVERQIEELEEKLEARIERGRGLRRNPETIAAKRRAMRG